MAPKGKPSPKPAPKPTPKDSGYQSATDGLHHRDLLKIQAGMRKKGS